MDQTEKSPDRGGDIQVIKVTQQMTSVQKHMKAAIAIGGNAPSRAGSPTETLCAALGDLSQRHVVVAASRFYCSPAFPPGSGPDFVNAVVVVRANSTPQALLGSLHEIEASFGRERHTRWGPRTLDLDLLLMGDIILPDRDSHAEWVQLSPMQQQSRTPESLILPHPRLQDRAFVLVPLAEIAPDWRHPVSGRTVSEMKAALPEADIEGIHPI